jgi:hypothetical protein
MKADAPVPCPVKGCRRKAKRCIGAGSGVIFEKGCGGFYSKDYGARNASDGSPTASKYKIPRIK